MKLSAEVSEIKTERQFERFLRDAGFPRAFAVAVTRVGFKAAAGEPLDDPAVPEIADAIKNFTALLRN